MTKEEFVYKWRNKSSFGSEQFNDCMSDLNKVIDAVLPQENVIKSVCDHYYPRKSNGTLMPCEFCGFEKVY